MRSKKAFIRTEEEHRRLVKMESKNMIFALAVILGLLATAFSTIIVFEPPPPGGGGKQPPHQSVFEETPPDKPDRGSKCFL